MFTVPDVVASSLLEFVDERGPDERVRLDGR